MNKIIMLCMAMGLVVTAKSQTPIILNEEDIASEGDSYTTINANPVIVFDGEATGVDYNWDFSDLTTLSEGVTNFVDVSDTDPLYFFLWLASDIAQQTTENIVNEFITIEDIYNFYKKDNDEFSLTGFAGTISGIPLPITYDEPEKIYVFPSEYNDVTSSESGFDISVPGFGGWSEQRSRTNQNDGWGTLTLPTDATTYNVLRTRSEITIVDTFSYDVYVIPFAYTTIEYRWMAKLNGMPMLQINTQTILGIETTSQVVYKTGDFVAINNADLTSFDFNVVPNPVDDEANIVFTSSVNDSYLLTVTNINGQKIMEKSLSVLNGSNSVFADLKPLAAGTYFISLFTNGNKVATQQIIKK